MTTGWMVVPAVKSKQTALTTCLAKLLNEGSAVSRSINERRRSMSLCSNDKSSKRCSAVKEAAANIRRCVLEIGSPAWTIIILSCNWPFCILQLRASKPSSSS
ncbi:hypothetical protein M514_14501 [Trichuris suis]|uniref:Uncharacterized protein n=1 Tax=Trichuris suis TaxID=68888 RepID=A0A085NUL5_9BILA|nr:hypothetical protein M514_14501 [Trichuris suis]